MWAWNSDFAFAVSSEEKRTEIESYVSLKAYVNYFDQFLLIKRSFSCVIYSTIFQADFIICMTLLILHTLSNDRLFASLMVSLIKATSLIKWHIYRLCSNISVALHWTLNMMKKTVVYQLYARKPHGVRRPHRISPIRSGQWSTLRACIPFMAQGIPLTVKSDESKMLQACRILFCFFAPDVSFSLLHTYNAFVFDFAFLHRYGVGVVICPNVAFCERWEILEDLYCITSFNAKF